LIGGIAVRQFGLRDDRLATVFPEIRAADLGLI
jgi:hypothetical protein